MIRFALKGLLGRKLRTRPDGDRDRARRRDGQRHLRPHGLDRPGLRRDLQRRPSRARTPSITGKSAFDLTDGSGATAPHARRVAARRRSATLPEVQQAEGGVDSESTLLIDKDGKAIVGGAPSLGFSIDRRPARPSTRSRSSRARWPGPNEVVIDEGTAKKEDFEVGDTIGVQAEGRSEPCAISGLVRFGALSSIGGATLAGFDLPTAQRLFDKEGSSTRSRVAVEVRTSRPSSSSTRSRACPADRPGADRPRRRRPRTRRGRTSSSTFLQGFLLAFAGIALFVGSFVIANSLAITIAQRTREFATIRTIGASRRQVLGSIVIEALVVGRSRRSSASSSGSRSRPGSSSCSTPSASRCRTAASSSRRARSSSRCSSASSSRSSRACGRRSGRRACRRSPPSARARRCPESRFAPYRTARRSAAHPPRVSRVASLYARSSPPGLGTTRACSSGSGSARCWSSSGVRCSLAVSSSARSSYAAGLAMADEDRRCRRRACARQRTRGTPSGPPRPPRR